MNRSARRAASFAPDTETTPESPVGVLDEPETAETPVEALADAPEAVPETPATFQPTVYMPVPASQLPQVEAPDIAAMVQKMMDEDVEDEPNVDEVAAKMSLESQIKAATPTSIVELPDGSLRIPVIVSQEMVVVIREWASGAGEDFEEYLQRTVEMGINAVVLGGSVAG